MLWLHAAQARGKISCPAGAMDRQPADTTEYLDLIMDALGDHASEETKGVVASDRAGVIVYANACASDILGAVRVGSGVDDYSCMHGIFTEDGRPYPSRDLPLSRAVLKKETTRNIPLVVRRCDGGTHRISVSGKPLYGPDGAHIGGVVTFVIVPPA